MCFRALVLKQFELAPLDLKPGYQCPPLSRRSDITLCVCIAANMVRTRAESVCKSFRHVCHAHQIESLGTISYSISTILRNSFRFLLYHQRIFPKFDAMRKNVA